jgi:hypothetical protein
LPVKNKKMLKRNLSLLVLLATMLPGQSPDTPALPAGTTAVEVAGGQFKIKFHFLAVGKQIYQCENGQWSASSTPDATLYDMNSDLKVRHGAGPSWTTVDGKSTIKAIGSTAIYVPAPGNSVMLELFSACIRVLARRQPPAALSTSCTRPLTPPTITSGFQRRRAN